MDKKGIKRLILALDNDGVGVENSEDICKIFSAEDIELFILEPSLMAPHKDPDEYVKAKAIASFKETGVVDFAPEDIL